MAGGDVVFVHDAQHWICSFMGFALGDWTEDMRYCEKFGFSVNHIHNPLTSQINTEGVDLVPRPTASLSVYPPAPRKLTHGLERFRIIVLVLCHFGFLLSHLAIDHMTEP